jgi:NAD(P)-dependent dehydrogenase (short-subunit alcohol dehydrogenase family)
VSKKVAFVTGASRGIGAEAAVALAQAGYDLAITARTLAEGERHDHIGDDTPLPGSLEATAAAIRARGREALCLPADILDQDSVEAAASQALRHFGHVDLLFNNAVYQGQGNQERLLDVSNEQLLAIYQGNVFTPLALIKVLLPGMAERGRGTIINMLSATAFIDPPAPADSGGWGFAYPSSKAALGRMAGSLRAEHGDSNLRVFNLEPGTVITELIKLAGLDRDILKRYKPCSPSAIGGVVAWLADNEPREDWKPREILRGPAIAKELGLLEIPSYLNPNTTGANHE